MRGVAILGLRTVLIQVATIGATIVLARLLSPRDYGLFAIGLAAQQFGRAALDVGLPVPMVRRPEPPSVDELRTLTGFILLVGSVVAAGTAAVAFALLPAFSGRSRVADVVAICCLAMPLTALRSASMVRLERGLAFGRIAAIEATETLGFYAFAVPAAAAGLGLYSLPVGVVVGAAASTLAALAVAPWRFGVSRSFRSLAPFARLGAAASLLYPLYLLRELGFVSVLTAAGGPTLAGFYGFAQRIFSLPTALSMALQRVSLPALAQVEAGPRRAHRAAQAIVVSAVAIGLPMAILVGTVRPLLAVVFDERWLPTAPLVFGAAPGILLISAVGAIVVGLFLANGTPRPTLESLFVAGILSVGGAALLTPHFGELGAGIALSVGLTASLAVAFARAPHELRGCISPLLRATFVAVVAAGAGNAAARGHARADLLVGAAVSGSVWLAGSLLVTRRELALLVSLGRSLRCAVR